MFSTACFDQRYLTSDFSCQLFGVGLFQAEGGLEYSRFVAPLRMVRIQAVVAQFGDVDDGLFCVR